jgi:protein TonB
MAMSVALHTLVAAGVVALPRASREAPPPEPMHLVFVDLIPPRGGPPVPGRSAETAPPPAAARVPEPHAPTRPQARVARREPVRESTPAHTRAPEPARHHAPDEERLAKPAVAPADAPVVSDGVALGGRGGGVPGGVAAHVYAAGAVSVPPVLVTREMPVYPPDARRREVEGVVLLEAIVDTDGRIEPASVKVRESVALLDAAAIDAVRRWRFRPGRDHAGAPVRVILEIPVRFVLR